jgi:hypothetical protein
LATTLVPAPGCDSMRNDLPTARKRSCMISNPSPRVRWSIADSASNPQPSSAIVRATLCASTASVRSETGHLGVLPQPRHRLLRGDGYADAGARRKLLAVRLQRYHESVIVEHQGAERAGHVAHDFHRPFHRRDGIS